MARSLLGEAMSALEVLRWPGVLREDSAGGDGLSTQSTRCSVRPGGLMAARA
jgi:hypothetical protein